MSTKLRELSFTNAQIRLLQELEIFEEISQTLENTDLEKITERSEKLAEIKQQIQKIIQNQKQKLQKQKASLSKVDGEIVKWRKSLNLLTDKPILRLTNIITDGENVPYLSDFELDILLEKEALEMSQEERVEFGLPQTTGLSRMIQACYSRLNLATFLTTGEMETRAWTFQKGSLAPQCAAVIHTDFAKKFIKAEVISFEDFVTCGSRKVAIEKGKIRSEGKEYVMKDGEVVEFKIGN